MFPGAGGSGGSGGFCFGAFSRGTESPWATSPTEEEGRLAAQWAHLPPTLAAPPDGVLEVCGCRFTVHHAIVGLLSPGGPSFLLLANACLCLPVRAAV